jgi:hypothetical protein
MRKGELIGGIFFMPAIGISVALLLGDPKLVFRFSGIGIVLGILFLVRAAKLSLRNHKSSNRKAPNFSPASGRLQRIGWMFIGVSLVLGLLASLMQLRR